MRAHTWLITFLLIVFTCNALVPPRFEWKVIDFAWENYGNRDIALDNRFYIPEANLPTGLARWRDKLFITIPRWKKGVPSSLNYINLTEDGPPNQPLHPYPSWRQGFLPDSACCTVTNSTVVSAFRPYVDVCNRLWVADNGAANMIRENGEEVRQIVNPSIMVFDLTTDTLLQKYEIPEELLKDSSVMSSIVVDTINPVAKTNDCGNSFAYITDMGANAVIVYSLGTNTAWKVESPFFHFDPHASTYNVGGIEFFWHDGVSSAALGPIGSDGYRELFLQPTSSTKLFKVSTQLLRNRSTHHSEYYTGVKIVGDRGPESQVTACDYDDKTNVLFYTQISKNGVGCWSLDKNFVEANHPVIFNDCELLEFPNDVKVDAEGNMWVISDREHRFRQSCMDFNKINFRIFQISVKDGIKNSTCWLDRLDSKSVTNSKETHISFKATNSGSSSYKTYTESDTITSSNFENKDTENNKIPNKEEKHISKDDKATKPLAEAKPIPYFEPKDGKKGLFLPSLVDSKPPVTNTPPQQLKSTKPDTLRQKQELHKEETPSKEEKPSKTLRLENKGIQTELPKGIFSKIDLNKNIWILSDRQSRFLYEGINPDDVNFRVFTAPVSKFIENTACETPGILTVLSRAMGIGKSSQDPATLGSQLRETRRRQSQQSHSHNLSKCAAKGCPVLKNQPLNRRASGQQSVEALRGQQNFDGNTEHYVENYYSQSLNPEIQSHVRERTTQGRQRLSQTQSTQWYTIPEQDNTEHYVENYYSQSLNPEIQSHVRERTTQGRQRLNQTQSTQWYTIPEQDNTGSCSICAGQNSHQYYNQSLDRSNQHTHNTAENQNQCGFSCCPIVKYEYFKELEQRNRLNPNSTTPRMHQSQNMTSHIINSQQVIRSNHNQPQHFATDTSNRNGNIRPGEEYQQIQGTYQSGGHQSLASGNQPKQSMGHHVPPLVVSPGPNPPRLPLVGETSRNIHFQESPEERSKICGAQLCGVVGQYEPIHRSCCDVGHSLKPVCCRTNHLGDPISQSCCELENSQKPLCCQVSGTNQSNIRSCCDEDNSNKPICCKINQNMNQIHQPPLLQHTKQIPIGSYEISEMMTSGTEGQIVNESRQQTKKKYTPENVSTFRAIGLPLAQSSKINQSTENSSCFRPRLSSVLIDEDTAELNQECREGNCTSRDSE